jgi:hypothetical protein
VGVTDEIVVAPAGRFKCDIEGTERALEVPHLGPTEGDCIVGEGEALGDSFGADASTQLGESGREPSQVVGVGRRHEIDVLGHVAFDIGLRHPPTDHDVADAMTIENLDDRGDIGDTWGQSVGRGAH